MPDIKTNEELSLDDSVKVNKNGSPILGRLQGPCADFINSTRNGRKYDESLWEKVFSDPIILEYFECGGIPGELDHPTDRSETCSEKIAIMMPEPPKKNSDGQLIATFDILDTPNGRITYTLAKYGYKLGISSRGSGDTYTDANGDEHVDEDSYDFQAFDIVLLPAVKTARMQLIDESLSNSDKTFNKAICEALEKSNDNEKKIMQETLKNLNISYSPEKVDYIYSNSEQVLEADNSGSDLVKDLQEALKKTQTLEKQVTDLQEKLSVCYAKETDHEVLIERYKNVVSKLSESKKVENALRKRLSVLIEQLKDKDTKNELNCKLIKSLQEKQQCRISTETALNESLLKKDSEIDLLQRKINSLTENLKKVRNSSKEELQALEESIADLKKDAEIKKAEYFSKLSNERAIVEKYKKVAKRAVEKYISSQATKLGVSTTEITSRLSESYSFDDIDKVCESLQQYQINISKLPFNTSRDQVVKMKVTESKEPIIPARFDDDIDESLMSLAGLN